MKDYQSRYKYYRENQRQRETEQKIVGASNKIAVWLIALSLLSFNLLGWLLYVNNSNSDNSEVNFTTTTDNNNPLEQQTIEEKPTTKLAQEKQDKPTKKQDSITELDNRQVEFTFYDNLKEIKLITGAKPFAKAPEQPYVVQAGSFLSKKSAENELKRLKKNGFKLNLNKLEIDGKTYYRLQSNIMTDKNVINAKRNSLRLYGIEATVMPISISKLSDQEKRNLYGDRDIRSLQANEKETKKAKTTKTNKPKASPTKPTPAIENENVKITSISLGSYTADEQALILDLLSDAGIDAIQFKNDGENKEIIVSPVKDYELIKKKLNEIGFLVAESPN